MSDEGRRARQLRENRDLPARAEPEEAALRRRNDEEGQGSRANYYPKSFQLVIAPVHRLERSPSRAQPLSRCALCATSPHSTSIVRYTSAHISINRCLDLMLFAPTLRTYQQVLRKYCGVSLQTAESPLSRASARHIPCYCSTHTMSVSLTDLLTDCYRYETLKGVTMVSCTVRGECCQVAYGKATHVFVMRARQTSHRVKQTDAPIIVKTQKLTASAKGVISLAQGRAWHYTCISKHWHCTCISKRCVNNWLSPPALPACPNQCSYRYCSLEPTAASYGRCSCISWGSQLESVWVWCWSSRPGQSS